MNFLLATFGTDGDVFPMIGLGKELIKTGHTVSFAASEGYRHAAEREQFKFLQLLSTEESETVLANPDFWHPHKCGPLAARWGVQYLNRQYELLHSEATIKPTVVVATLGVLAARLLHDKTGIPFATVILQPWVLPSIHKPPAIPGAFGIPNWAPKFTWRIYFHLLNFAGYMLFGRDLNKLRTGLGLRPVKRVFDWWISPQLILAMFPPWYGPPQPDWPSHTRLFSFPTFDGDDQPLSPEIEKFLAQGEPPVAITFGTGVRHAASLYKEAVDGCIAEGKRAVLLTKFENQIPKQLPSSIIAVSFAPFSKLFPRCAAVIHHGGIGTSGKALSAKIPQLIVPICFDQLDNALRVQKLGGGTWLKKHKATSSNVARKLREAMEIFRKNMAAIPSNETDPFAEAAAHLEQLGDRQFAQ